MSSRECDHIDLVRRAQRGDRESLDRLAEAARVRLSEYVFRLTLAEDLTQDIVQETILDMLRLFGRLRRADRFWAWLYGIAFNKVRNHYGKQWRHKTRSLTEKDCQRGTTRDGALAGMAAEELRQIVLSSVQSLEPRHRAVLTMRCYDDMSYAEIARVMGCSEIGTRALFYRAKKVLTRRLSTQGLGKGSLLMALVVFGKMTAVSEATAMKVSVTAATLSVGPLAAVTGIVTGKAGLVTLTATVLLAAGSVVALHEPPTTTLGFGVDGPTVPPEVPWRAEISESARECWYYFPEGADQVVMRRLVGYAGSEEKPTWLALENQYASYLFHHASNTLFIRNCRTWEADLRVTRLPTDSPRLRGFLSQVEGRQWPMDSVSADQRGLLVICRRAGGSERKVRQIDQHLNVLQEEYFQFGWPESARVVDQRDPTHQKGRMGFRVTGQIDGTSVFGTGRVPLVYAACRLHPAWLDLHVGSRWRVIDTEDGAVCYHDRRVVSQYVGGSFFRGLARPWMGLHVIDTVRRDAAEQELPFETHYDGQRSGAQVWVHAGAVTLAYTIDMERDRVERIEWLATETGDTGARQGRIEFAYVEDIDDAEAKSIEPSVRVTGNAQRNREGMLWLTQWLEPESGLVR